MVRRPRLRRHRPARRAQAADRRDRGLRGRRRLRDRAGLRPGRRRRGRQARHPGGQALAGRRGRRAAAAAQADALPRGHGAGADRRPDAGRALPRVRRRQPARAQGRGARRGAGAGGDDRQERPAGARGLQGDHPVAVRLEPRGDVGEAGRDQRPGLRVGGRQGGRVGLQGEARPRRGRAASAQRRSQDRRSSRLSTVRTSRGGRMVGILVPCPCGHRRSSRSGVAGSRWSPGTRCSTTTCWGRPGCSGPRSASSPPPPATPTTTSCASTGASRPWPTPATCRSFAATRAPARSRATSSRICSARI